MTGMANELTKRGESLSFEVWIFSENENSEPSSDLFSSSAIGTSWIDSEVWDKAGYVANFDMPMWCQFRWHMSSSNLINLMTLIWNFSLNFDEAFCNWLDKFLPPTVISFPQSHAPTNVIEKSKIIIVTIKNFGFQLKLTLVYIYIYNKIETNSWTKSNVIFWNFSRWTIRK